jgi:hypothetical protein
MQAPQLRIENFTIALACVLGAFSATAAPAQSRSDPLSTIKRQLGPRGVQARRDATWYVVLLREQTQQKISVTYIKVQGQDAAAQRVLEFLQRTAPGYRDFVGRHFPDTDKGREDANAFYESELTAGVRSVLLLTLGR